MQAAVIRPHGTVGYVTFTIDRGHRKHDAHDSRKRLRVRERYVLEDIAPEFGMKVFAIELSMYATRDLLA